MKDLAEKVDKKLPKNAEKPVVPKSTLSILLSLEIEIK